MQRTGLRWLPGPKHGIGRGVGVFGSSGFDEPDRLYEVLGRCPKLRTWASRHGLALNDEPDSLTALDQRLDGWGAEPEIGPTLANEVGTYVGTVIVKTRPGAAWRAWPNGHPVVRLPSGTEINVIAEVQRRIVTHSRTLTSIFTNPA